MRMQVTFKKISETGANIFVIFLLADLHPGLPAGVNRFREICCLGTAHAR